MTIKTSLSRLLFGSLAVSFATILGLLLGELTIRIFVPRSRWTLMDARIDWQSDPDAGWIQKPNLQSTIVRGDLGWTVDFHTNRDGLLPPGASRQKPPGTFRIMIFGDSTVVGRAVPERERIHVKLQHVLAARGIRAEVINAGVQGYSTDQELVVIARLAPLYRPDLILLAVCDNDFDANLADTAFGISKPLFEVKDGRIVGRSRPKPALLRISTDYGFTVRRLLQYSALYRLFQPQLLTLRYKYKLFKVLLGTKSLSAGPAADYHYNPEAAKALNLEVFEALLKEMKKTADATDAKFGFYLHPSVSAVWEPYIRETEKSMKLLPGAYDRYVLERRMEAIAARDQLSFCPLIDYFAQHQSRGPFHLLPRDPHCNAQGYQLSAEAIAEWLLQSGEVPSAQHFEAIRTVTLEAARRGQLHAPLARQFQTVLRCGLDWCSPSAKVAAAPRRAPDCRGTNSPIT